MSDILQAFKQRIAETPELKERIGKLAALSPEEAISQLSLIAREAGFDLSAEDIAAAGDGLDDESLAGIAGGSTKYSSQFISTFI